MDLLVIEEISRPRCSERRKNVSTDLLFNIYRRFHSEPGFSRVARPWPRPGIRPDTAAPCSIFRKERVVEAG